MRAARARRMRPTREYFHKNGKKTAVLLTAPWCGWCKKLKGELGELKQLLDKMNVELDHIEDEKEVKDYMAKDNRAKGFPSCLLMDENGKIVDVLSGFRPAKEFAKAVKEKYRM
jgi:thiol-disulfide isomerase/thioredoxin